MTTNLHDDSKRQHEREEDSLGPEAKGIPHAHVTLNLQGCRRLAGSMSLRPLGGSHMAGRGLDGHVGLFVCCHSFWGPVVDFSLSEENGARGGDGGEEGKSSRSRLEPGGHLY